MCYTKSFKFIDLITSVKNRRSEKNGLLELLLSSFKRSKNLPYPIRTNLCPKSKKNCKRHHGEIVVESYDSDLKLFHCVYYGVHAPKKIYETDQTEELVRNMIKKSLTKLYHDNKPLVTVREIKKILDIERKNAGKMTGFACRCTVEQKEILRSIAKGKGLELSDYIIMKLFS